MGSRRTPKAPRAAEELCTRVYSCRLGPTLERALEAAVARVQRGESAFATVVAVADKATLVREAMWRGFCDLASEDEEYLSDRAQRGPRAANATVKERYRR